MSGERSSDGVHHARRRSAAQRPGEIADRAVEISLPRHQQLEIDVHAVPQQVGRGVEIRVERIGSGNSKILPIQAEVRLYRKAHTAIRAYARQRDNIGDKVDAPSDATHRERSGDEHASRSRYDSIAVKLDRGKAVSGKEVRTAEVIVPEIHVGVDALRDNDRR